MQDECHGHSFIMQPQLCMLTCFAGCPFGPSIKQRRRPHSSLQYLGPQKNTAQLRTLPLVLIMKVNVFFFGTISPAFIQTTKPMAETTAPSKPGAALWYEGLRLTVMCVTFVCVCMCLNSRKLTLSLPVTEVITLLSKLYPSIA